MWASPLCFEYRASGIKMVSDFFPVERESGAELAVGLLMTGRGECRVRVADQPQLLRSDKPADPSRSTPYILYLSRATGAVLRLRKFDVVEADLIRRAVPRGGDGYTFVGMALRGGDTTTQCVSGHGASGRRLWSTTVQTPHAHHFLWSQAYADTANPLTLFIADPSEYVELNGRRVQHGGLLFGGMHVSHDLVCGLVLITPPPRRPEVHRGRPCTQWTVFELSEVRSPSFKPHSALGMDPYDGLWADEDASGEDDDNDDLRFGAFCCALRKSWLPWV